MTPSGQDIQLKFNPESIIANFRKVERTAADAMKAIGEGAKDAGAKVEKFSKELGQFSQGVATFTERAKQSQERYITSLEKTANALGKTRDSATISWLNEYTKGLGNNEKAIARVNAVKQKWVEYEKSQGAKAMENEIKALEKRAALYGKSGIERLQAEMQEQVKLHNENAEAVKRVTAAYQQLIAVERQEAVVAREREIQGIQRQGRMAGMNPEERLRYERDEAMTKFGGDQRVADSYEQRRIALKKESAEQTERELAALEKRGNLIGKGQEERILEERAEMMEKYNNDQRAAAYYAKQLVELRRQETQAVEKETLALEKQARLGGLRGAALKKAELQEEIALGKLDTETINRRTAAIERLALVEKATGHGGNLNLLGRGARDLFEGRTAYGTMDIVRAMTGGLEGGMTGGAALGAGAGAAVAGIAAAGMVGFKAAEGIGEFANKIHETQVATGMSAEEVQRFQIAEKLAGAGAVDAQRLMRGLTNAVMENSTAGEKARKGLRDLGVDYVGLQMGTVSTSQALAQLSEGLKKNGNVFETNSALMETFKRLGIEGKETIIEYGEALKKTENFQFLSQDQVDLMKETHNELVLMKEAFGAIFTQIELIVGSGFVEFMKDSDAAAKEFMKIADPLHFWYQEPAPKLTADDLPKPEGWAINRFAYKEARSDYLEKRYTDFIGSQPDQEAMDRELQRRKNAKDEALANSKLSFADFGKFQTAVASTKAAYDSYKAIYDARKNAEEARKTIAQELIRMGVDAEDRLKHPDELPTEARLRKFIDTAQALPPGERQAAIDKATGKLQPLIDRDAADRAAKFTEQKLEQQQTYEREMAHIRLGGIPPVDIRELGARGVTRADVEGDINRQYQQRLDNAQKLHDDEVRMLEQREAAAKTREQKEAVALSQIAIENDLQKQGAEARAEADKERYALTQREHGQEIDFQEQMSKLQLASEEEAIKHDAELERKRAELRFKGESPAGAIAEEYRIATDEAQKLYDKEMERIQLHESGHKADIVAQDALNNLKRQGEAATEEHEFRLAKLHQDQLDKLKGAVEPLFQTLFTDPKNFGKQLRTTVTGAALHPIVSGLSEMTATALHPLIYGADGKGGLSSLFGGIFGAHTLGDVKPVHNSIPVWIMNLPATSRLGPLPGLIDTSELAASTSVSGSGGVVGHFGSQLRRYIQDASSSYTPGLGYQGGGGTGADFSTTVYAPGEVPTYADGSPAFGNIPGYSGGGFGSGTVAGPRGGGFGGGGFNLSSLTSMGRNMESSWKQLLGFGAVHGKTPGSESLARAAEGPGVTPGGAFSWSGLAHSPLARAGAGTAGMMLAQRGLMGSSMGTGGGVLEGMLGGAGIGFAVGGGPVGAAIGAGAGLAIGVGELIAGVETQRNEAKRLVQSVYHIGINNTTADQIVSMANQSYGGSVSVAVRSPDVRHMLGLYAAGTGQANTFTMGSGDPHGASLVESGGVLSQQATYQYGQAYSQSSNLPVYGGTPTHTLGAPGGGMSLSLNIAGTDAAKFMTGQVVTPDVVQTQYAAAMNNSNGRVAQALMMSEPGSIQA